MRKIDAFVGLCIVKTIHLEKRDRTRRAHSDYPQFGRIIRTPGSLRKVLWKSTHACEPLLFFHNGSSPVGQDKGPVKSGRLVTFEGDVEELAPDRRGRLRASREWPRYWLF